MLNDPVTVIRTGSKITCVYKSILGFIGAFICVIISLILVSIRTEKRSKVNVNIVSATSSHELENKNLVQIQSDEQIVEGTHVTGSSTENCQQHTYRNGRRTSTCTCNGYTFQYNNKTARCPGHSGRCRRKNRNEMIYNSQTQILRCKNKNDKINCILTFDDNTTLACPYDNCPQPGYINIPKNKANGEYLCPRPNWNYCTYILEYKGKMYTWTETSNDSCEGLINTTKSLYYSEKEDNFTKTHSDSSGSLKVIAFILLVCAIIIGFHSWALLNFESYCHTNNIAHAISGKNRRYDSKSVIHTHTSSNTFRAEQFSPVKSNISKL